MVDQGRDARDRHLTPAARCGRSYTPNGPFDAGSGPVVAGPTLALAMALAGRVAYCDELTGDGVDTLRERCTQL